MCILGGRGDCYLSRRHWRLLQDRRYGCTSQHGDTVPENSVFLYSPHHPTETGLLLPQSGPSLGLPGQAFSSVAGTPPWLHACPSGPHRPCPTGHGRKPPHLQNICLTHSLAAIAASLQKKKKLHVRRRDTFCINPFVELFDKDLLNTCWVPANSPVATAVHRPALFFPGPKFRV